MYQKYEYTLFVFWVNWIIKQTFLINKCKYINHKKNKKVLTAKCYAKQVHEIQKVKQSQMNEYVKMERNRNFWDF